LLPKSPRSIKEPGRDQSSAMYEVKPVPPERAVVEPNQSAIRGLLLSREATGNDPKGSTLELAHYPKSPPAMALTDD
jgi:hypothetical protein